MAQFGCGGSRCTCQVTAGPGVTVTGNGSAGAPYVIESEAGTVTCDQVRPCISAGDGASYDPATGVVAARPSTDAGNSLGFGTDGGLLVPPAGAPALEAGDTDTVDTTVTGAGVPGDPFVVSADVKLDPTPPQGGTNLIGSGAEGLFLECADVRGCFTAGDGIAYDPDTGEIAARVSEDAGNQTVIGTDGGIYTPASGGSSTSLAAGDSDTVDTTVAGSGTEADPFVVSSTVILDPTPPQGGTNLIGSGTEGLFLECADVRGCFTAGDGIAYDETTGEIAARPSTDAGNGVSFGTDGGLYAPAASTALQAGDTNTVDTTITGTGEAGDPYVVAADVIVAPEPNGLEATDDGLLVAPSADAGNQLTMGTDGRLFVPPDEPLEIGCGLQGDGTAAAPLAAFPIAGEQPWTDDWDCDAAANSTLKCDPGTGALWTPPEHTSAAVTLQQNHPVTGLAFTDTGGAVVVSEDAWSAGQYTADTLTTCRGVSYSVRFTGHLEVSWTANARFDVGYAIQIDGGGLAVRLMHSILADGPAGRERWTFNLSEAAVLPPHTGKNVRVYPAIRVTAGTATIQQWITDTDLIVITR
ncbi:hypothetical protein [Streptomyces sp. CCM_MD2014]|uniref:hypothetical protein n=1 Tax=Streptomyces sp. CCM_MD2014 TaxID=1561022 RepID=UPI00052A6D3B|nr:hypothetical protein [Streptomyces sp. CCM_MD2014]AIV35630.1 hypothetical protein NI25_20770 [Streptomyces sp. CCM_MD2014]